MSFFLLLSELLKGVNVKNEYIDREISDVTDNTKKVTGNCAFVCVSGARFDGHNFAKEVMENGAVTVIVSKDLGLKEGLLVVAILRGRNIIFPTGIDEIKEKDTIVVIDDDSSVKDINDILE